MNPWYMLTVVGADRPGIVAGLSTRLFEGGCQLGETAMTRLGGNFSMMLMTQSERTLEQIQALVQPVAQDMGLRIHVDAIDGRLHQHIEPDTRVSVYGADRAGIVAQVTSALADTGFNILALDSDVGGTREKPFYIMHIEGQAGQGLEVVETALAPLSAQGVDVRVGPLQTLIG